MGILEEHPKLQPDDEDRTEAQWYEVGWMAAKLYVDPEDPERVMMKWHSEGLDFFRQIGMVEELAGHLSDLGAEYRNPDAD